MNHSSNVTFDEMKPASAIFACDENSPQIRTLKEEVISEPGRWATLESEEDAISEKSFLYV